MSMMVLGIVEPRFSCSAAGVSGSATRVHTTDRCYGPLGGAETMRLYLLDSERFISFPRRNCLWNSAAAANSLQLRGGSGFFRKKWILVV